uniref:Uncharacterized protein n=1 Tax=Cyanothece sp. (strain PCC 7425 / ATCC 29141) TaxID=395961 RepID=B8HS91_CYAP4
MLDNLLFFLICLLLSLLLILGSELESDILAVLGSRELCAEEIAVAIARRHPQRRTPSAIVLHLALFWLEKQGYLSSRVDRKAATNPISALLSKRLYRRTGTRRPTASFTLSPARVSSFQA